MSKKLVSCILAITLTVLCLSPAAFAYSGNIDKNIVKASSEVAVNIESEGIVLLKNEDNILPLSGKKINVFGAGSVNPFYGGAGSGAITTDDPVSLYDAFDEIGIEYNKELRELYEKECGSNEIPKTDNTVINNLLQLTLAHSSNKEMNAAKLTDKIMKTAVEFSDIGIIIISRTSAENSDLSEETLRLSSDEEALVKKVASSFKNVIVLFNIGNVMEMGWIDDYESIKAAAIIWIPGEFGMLAVAKMLNGEVNPSGKLADTVAYNVSDHPSSENFGDFSYTLSTEKYVEYQEGIYVGYRYFETFNPKAVQFPFGYGLSYTEFSKSVCSYDTTGDKITVKIKVKNIGDVAGKEIVQVYYSAPYTYGGIEKSAICLGGYGKTSLLKPGESDIVTVSFAKNDMASYDCNLKEAWVLEKGIYKIIVAENVKEHIDEFDYTVENDVVIKNDSVTGTEIKNLFGDVRSDFTVLSRADAENTYPASRQLKATADIKNMDKLPDPIDGEKPKIGVKYDEPIMLRDVYEDESLWDAFLDQLTLDEMARLVVDAGYETYGIDRLGIPATWDNDGPSSVKGREGLLYTDCGIAYPCETCIACTWNDELAEEMGASIGIEARNIGTDTWYAPGANTHRNPMGGRNFEYFSEDPLLSGKMAAAVIRGAYSEGLITTIKHFALNDQETNRTGVLTWADEQTMREIYLKAFEIAIKESKNVAVMSAFNRLGTTWCGASSALLNDLLRKEWGFEGFVVSDYSSNFTGAGYMDPALGVYNGNDAILSGIWVLNAPGQLSSVKLKYYRDPVGFGNALRTACKNICIAKMHTKAFLTPDNSYDSSLAGALVDINDWNFESPYFISAIRFALNNFMNIILYGIRYIL